jgi:hypothetical protein
MRIAQITPLQIAPLMENVPPGLYGGPNELSPMSRELVGLGHEVTLFASADSLTAAKPVSRASMALRLDSNVRDPGEPRRCDRVHRSRIHLGKYRMITEVTRRAALIGLSALAAIPVRAQTPKSNPRPSADLSA